ncbi:MAG: serine/threonine protein kinase [Deltaproteobacteria bacterium]|nr:serine/threonine protein kinase [Deltaproteobacteria bacterium]
MATTDYAGEVLDGKYRLTTLLGKGGMGSVYRGQHVVIGKLVAVKFLHAEFAGSEEVVKRFYREAQAAAAIGHDGIIDVMDVGIAPTGEPYLVMEFLEGESLADLLIRAGPLDASAAVGIFEPALQALQAAHAKNIVHRDLKPENIFLQHREGAPPRVKLIDFGISKITAGPGGEKLTQTGSVMGTPAYMSPEQARGSTELDHRADIYSMGVILYEMLTGRLPFEGENFTEIIISILTEEPIPPREAHAEFPPDAEEVLLRSLIKDPAGRYGTALEFAEALKGLSGYETREAQLTSLAASAKHTSFASGSLGPTTDGADGESVAADVMAQVSGGAATPTGWAGTQVPQKKSGRGKGVVVIVVIAAVISIGGIGGLLWMLTMRGQAAPVAPIAPPGVPIAQPPSHPKAVTITVNGAPDGARLYFDGVLITINPFNVKYGEAGLPLKVEAEGHLPFERSVIPSSDQLVPVKLEPAPEPAPEPAKKKKKRRKKKKK